MRNMSFSMTTEQYRQCEKTVTRRDGWWDLAPGDVFMGCEKCMGLKKGEKVKHIHPALAVATWPEPLSALLTDSAYGRSEMVKEGFPELTPGEFCDMYMAHNGGDLETLRNRIEFEHL